MKTHADLESRWDELVETREQIRTEVERRVVDKAWGSVVGGWERPEPLYAERSRFPNGRLSKKRPPSLAGVKEYGYDDRERVVLAREFNIPMEQAGDGWARREPEVPFDVANDEYFVYLDDGAESYRFQSQWLVEGRDFTRRWVVQLAQVNRHWLDESGRVTRYDTYRGPDHGVWESERYEYLADGQLARVYVGTWSSRTKGPRVADLLQEELTYDEAGKLAAIRDVLQDEVIWRRPPKTLAPAKQLVEDALVTAVAEWAREHWPAEPVFALGLGATGAFPYQPVPGFLTVAERDAILAEGDDEFGVGLSLWNPADYSTFDPEFEPDESAEFAEALRLLRQEAELTDDETSSPKLLGQVAARLAALDWDGHARGEDFVVFAIDMEIESEGQIATALRRSAPKETVKEFKRRGWLRVID